MTSISHALIGAALAAKIGSPVPLAVVGIVVHFMCDAIPHWDLGTNWRLRPKSVTGVLAILETLTALFGTFLLFQKIFVGREMLLAIGIIASLLPDWLLVPYYLTLPHPPKLFLLFKEFQSHFHNRLQTPWGVYTQIATVGVFLALGFLL